MQDALISSPHLHGRSSIAVVMREVIIALIPGILLSTWLYGWGVLIHCLLAIGCALIIEATMLRVRGQPVALFLKDGSAMVTALLFSLAVTPYAPWWVDVIGMIIAIVAVKHLYGGLGQNLFNPAMAGYVFVLLCFPATLTIWPTVTGGETPHAGFMQSLAIIFTGQPLAGGLDGLSGATPLGYMKSQLNNMAMVEEIRSAPLFGTFAGKNSEWLMIAWLGGGVWLFYRRIITWRLPAIFLGTLFLTSLLCYWFDASRFPSPLFSLFAGGAMIAAFFIITDPVTAPASPSGVLIYGTGIGLLTFLIRTWGSYPEGVAFAVLIMNAAVPLLDALTRPRGGIRRS